MSKGQVDHRVQVAIDGGLAAGIATLAIDSNPGVTTTASKAQQVREVVVVPVLGKGKASTDTHPIPPSLPVQSVPPPLPARAIPPPFPPLKAAASNASASSAPPALDTKPVHSISEQHTRAENMPQRQSACRDDHRSLEDAGQSLHSNAAKLTPDHPTIKPADGAQINVPTLQQDSKPGPVANAGVSALFGGASEFNPHINSQSKVKALDPAVTQHTQHVDNAPIWLQHGLRADISSDSGTDAESDEDLAVQ